MSKEELLARLEELQKQGDGDPEVAHCEADAALLAFINDPAITAAWEEIPKWFA